MKVEQTITVRATVEGKKHEVELDIAQFTTIAEYVECYDERRILLVLERAIEREFRDAIYHPLKKGDTPTAVYEKILHEGILPDLPREPFEHVDDTLEGLSPEQRGKVIGRMQERLTADPNWAGTPRA